MNFCIVYGVILTDVDFKFILNKKNKSIAYFDFMLSNRSIIKVKAFDEKADYIYKKLKIGDYMIIKGRLSNDGCLEYIYSEKIKI